MSRENAALRRTLASAYAQRPILGDSPGMRKALDRTPTTQDFAWQGLVDTLAQTTLAYLVSRLEVETTMCLSLGHRFRYRCLALCPPAHDQPATPRSPFRVIFGDLFARLAAAAAQS